MDDPIDLIPVPRTGPKHPPGKAQMAVVPAGEALRAREAPGVRAMPGFGAVILALSADAASVSPGTPGVPVAPGPQVQTGQVRVPSGAPSLQAALAEAEPPAGEVVEEETVDTGHDAPPEAPPVEQLLAAPGGVVFNGPAAEFPAPMTGKPAPVAPQVLAEGDPQPAPIPSERDAAVPAGQPNAAPPATRPAVASFAGAQVPADPPQAEPGRTPDFPLPAARELPAAAAPTAGTGVGTGLTEATAKPVERQRPGFVAELAQPVYEAQGTARQHAEMTSSSLQAMRPAAGAASPLPTTIPETVVAQLSQQLSTPGRTEMTIRLDPPELGHVRIGLSLTDGHAAAVVSVDRADVESLLRRHAGQLSQALSSAGYASVDLEFRHDGAMGGGERPDGRTPARGDTTPASLASAKGTDAQVTLGWTTSAGGLDLRF